MGEAGRQGRQESANSHLCTNQESASIPRGPVFHGIEFEVATGRSGIRRSPSTEGCGAMRKTLRDNGRGLAAALVTAALAATLSLQTGIAADKAPAPKAPEPARLDLSPAASPLKPVPPKAATIVPASNDAPSDAPAQKGSKAAELLKPEAVPAPAPPAAATGAAPKGAVMLKYKWETNQIFYFDSTSLMSISTRKDQTAETAMNESRSFKHYRVVSVDSEGNALLELIIDRVKMLARFGENDPLTFDSDSKSAPPPQLRGIRDGIGKPTARVQVSMHGTLKDVTRLGDAAPGKGAVPDNDPSNNFLTVLPEKPIEVGGTWSEKIDVRVSVSKELTQSVSILRKFQLDAIEGNIARISMDSTVLTPVNDPMIKGQLIQRTPSAKIVFDIEKGQIVSRETRLDKTEIGVLGPNSSMRAVGEFVERMVTRDQIAKLGEEPLRSAVEVKKTASEDKGAKN